MPTCGKGIAANAVIPAHLAKLLTVQADVLERHIRALDPDDAASRQERTAYLSLVQGHRDIASQLDGLSEQMTGYRDLPMGQHDMRVMTNPNGQMEAFQRFVVAERELLSLLQEKLKAEEAMLG